MRDVTSQGSLTLKLRWRERKRGQLLLLLLLLSGVRWHCVYVKCSGWPYDSDYQTVTRRQQPKKNFFKWSLRFNTKMEDKSGSKDNAEERARSEDKDDGGDVTDFAYGDIEIVCQQARRERKSIEEQLSKFVLDSRG